MRCVFLRGSVVAGVLLGVAFVLSGCGGGSGDTAPPAPPVTGCSAWSGLLQLDVDVSHSVINSVAASGPCRYLIAGYERSTHTGEPQGDSRGFIRHFQVDPSGAVQWEWEYLLDTAGADAVLGFEVVADEIRFWGTTDAAIDGQLNRGKKDLVLGVIGLDGQQVKLSQLGNEKPNVPVKLVTTGSGDQYLVGNDEVYVPTNYVETWEDPWLASVAEYPSFFVLDWIANRDTETTDFHTDAVPYGESIILASYAASGADRGISLQRQLPSGEVSWSLQLSGSPYDIIGALDRDTDNDRLLVFGSTYLQLGSTTAGEADYFLASLDPEQGDVHWLRQFGTPALDWSKGLIAIPSGIATVGDRMAADGTWAVDVRTLSPAGDLLEGRTLLLGRSTNAVSAAYASQGLLVVGKYETEQGRSTGFLKLFAGGI